MGRQNPAVSKISEERCLSEKIKGENLIHDALGLEDTDECVETMDDLLLLSMWICPRTFLPTLNRQWEREFPLAPCYLGPVQPTLMGPVIFSCTK